MDTDILISGGGIAGLTAAAAFGTAGYRVICVDPATPAEADQRSTAFLQPAIGVLDAAGLWDDLRPHAAPLQVMQIVDSGRSGAAPRTTARFDAVDISDHPFGWNIPNQTLRQVMAARVADLPTVTHITGTATDRLMTRQSEAKVTLTDGTRIRARLVIAADGRDSPMRPAAGIGTRTTRFGQRALVFTVTHPIPHDNISTEVHRSGGPFTLVPLPDRGGQPCSAVVWMEAGPTAERLRALPQAEFEAAITDRSAGLLGALTLASPIGSFPIIAQMADRMGAERLVLMAEAAHVLPPIGAQGLNTSLADLAALLDLADPATLGDAAMIEAYHRRRHADAKARMMGVGLLNRASMTGLPPLQDLRATLLAQMHGIAPLRRSLMRMGLGVR
ncbi:UbiH/UbiF family hydroxylase [Falsirhodobacter halotolerans]|uniref:UbiH/UbiF family hydroxylase n=1 Tax=Falsirhodobacter halotolerans TaxID=1146892 RepID=UPI001FD2CA2E|nr:UbiH/UbiF family hydroxylase [Falsirhodobacter halotolerans]MCJ8140239.1 UbiH/UbiF family hydroxylase [Falsirhodobacter halotolerans]